MRVNLLLIVVVLCMTPALFGAETHPLTIHDMLAMERISGPQVSPGGDRIAFTLRTTDLEANRGRTDIWLVGLDGSGLRRMTAHEASDFEPRWSPDGKHLYFLASTDVALGSVASTGVAGHPSAASNVNSTANTACEIVFFMA